MPTLDYNEHDAIVHIKEDGTVDCIYPPGDEDGMASEVMVAAYVCFKMLGDPALSKVLCERYLDPLEKPKDN